MFDPVIGTPRMRRALALAVDLHNDYRTHPELKRIIVQLIQCIERELEIPDEKSIAHELSDR